MKNYFLAISSAILGLFLSTLTSQEVWATSRVNTTASCGNRVVVPSAPSIVPVKTVSVINDPVLTPVLVPINNVITVPVPVYNYFYQEEFFGNGHFYNFPQVPFRGTISDRFYDKQYNVPDQNMFKSGSNHNNEVSEKLVELIVNKVVEKLLKDLQDQSKDVKLPPVKTGNGNGNKDLNEKVFTILNNNCSQCHTGPKSKGKFVIFVQNDILNLDLDKKLVYEVVKEGFMPPSNTRFRVKPEELEIIRLWSQS